MCQPFTSIGNQVKNEENPGPIFRFWCKLYAAAPKLYVPGTEFDVALTILSAASLSIVRLINEYIIYDKLLGFDISNPKTVDCAACSTSMVHSIILCISLWPVLHDQGYNPASSIVSKPKYFQDTVTSLMQFCTGYMIYDFIFMLRINQWSLHPDDFAYAAHHIVTSIYMNQTRVLRAGHISAMTFMFSGELSNPLQNFHMINRFAIQMKDETTFWHSILPYSEFSYAVVYFFLRSVVGSIQVLHNTYTLLSKEGRKNIPIYISFFWLIMAYGVIIGSYPWTYECLEMIKDGLQVKYHKDWDYGSRYEL